jgi:hypothetical protein
MVLNRVRRPAGLPGDSGPIVVGNRRRRIRGQSVVRSPWSIGGHRNGAVGDHLMAEEDQGAGSGGEGAKQCFWSIAGEVIVVANRFGPNPHRDAHPSA